MKVTQPSKTPTKQYLPPQPSPNPPNPPQQPLAQIHQTSLKILTQQSPQQITKSLIQNKLTSFTLKNQKCLTLLNMSRQIFNTMMVEGQGSQEFLRRVIGIWKNNGKKVYQVCRCLRYFGDKDYQFQYIVDVAKATNTEPISFYTKCRTAICESFLNKTKKQLLSSVTGSECTPSHYILEQWYKIVQKIFKSVQKQTLIELFTDTIKFHYLSIKKNQNQLLNGAEIFRICQIMDRNIRESQGNQLYSFDQREQITNGYNQSTSRFAMAQNEQRQDERTSTKTKQRQSKRLFQKNVVDGLQSQDRQLIRILSYKDNNIARMLQKKHQKMIELIVDDVQTMRRSIEEEKQKYVELWKEKEEILKFVDNINHLSLNYVGNDSLENQEKLLKAIQGFNYKFKSNTLTTQELRRVKDHKKNKRLIELIQRQQRQKN